MSNALTSLSTYASSDPASLPPTVLLRSSDDSIVIWDKFPKAMFHFLLLPRIKGPLTRENTTNLSSFIKWDKSKALNCLLSMKGDAEAVKVMIQDEMTKKHGFTWDIWMGFHSVPSMEHVHLHIISSDLCSPALKNKKHYNSFHPKLGFFLHFDEVMSWFEDSGNGGLTLNMPSLREEQYEPLLKTDLTCWKCGEEVRNIPLLKSHLEDEWKKERKESERRGKR
ncbi:hypothetical protein BOTBODRAFT_34672 [Botryobasidium botryosum FD-172 SS1]|uniref:Aprataxin C2HE/C2H2/C2HC zinc finger domain-containing protein n=1 Tax=Botryobasidium botryosum (strain FD-172 SS1) TaxID=930990 RepID=A0A067M9F0_BOTB1|nr:hypothetical protein BOTBODRAFT_34672 [Botryobasidium botryosum FD-172 SS1]